jgi:hypothetical protein
MKRPLTILGLAAAAALLPVSTPASAADPKTADCLAASEASLKAATQHRLRDERAQLIVCAAPSCPGVIRMECLSHVDEVNARIPTIVFAARDASGADLSAVTIEMDGERLTDRLDGAALSVDPGEHVFTFDTPGQPRVTRRLMVQEAVKDRHELVQFGAPRATAQPEAESTGHAARGPGLGTQRAVALAAAGVGLVGLGLGAAFGAVALSEKSDAEGACPGATCNTQSGSTKWSNAASSGNISTVGLVVGAVGVGAAAVLWFTAPRAGSGQSAQVGVGPGVVQLRGTW